MIPVEVGTYVHALLAQGQGYPLWNPNPSRSFSTAYKNKGCGIGDLCIITPDGSVDFLWNICYPHSHPVNFGRTPPDFVPVGIDLATDVDEEEGWRGNWGHVCNLSIKQHHLAVNASLEASPFIPSGFHADLESSTSDIRAGVLVLPEGADRYDVLRLDEFREYAKRNARSWYKHVNGPAFRRGASEDSLYLVTGCKKTTSWAAASFRHYSEHRGVTVEVKAAMLAGGGVSAGYSWVISCPATARSGPPNPTGGTPTNTDPPQNQCVFIKGFKIALREGMTQKLGLRPAISLETNPAKVKPGSKGPIPFRHSGGNAGDTGEGHGLIEGKLGMGAGETSPDSKLSFGKVKTKGARSGTVVGKKVITSDPKLSPESPPHGKAATGKIDGAIGIDIESPDMVVMDFPTTPEHDLKFQHPSDIINEWLLSNTEKADIAITHDDVWCSVLQKDDLLFPSAEELLRRIGLHHVSYLSFPNTVALHDRRANRTDVPQKNRPQMVQKGTGLQRTVWSQQSKLPTQFYR